MIQLMLLPSCCQDPSFDHAPWPAAATPVTVVSTPLAHRPQAALKPASLRTTILTGVLHPGNETSVL
jgi:hypothetical protein